MRCRRPRRTAACRQQDLTAQVDAQADGCDPKRCDPKRCDPKRCDPKRCDPKRCDPATGGTYSMGLTHQERYDSIHSAEPRQMHATADQWTKNGNEMVQVPGDLTRAIAGSEEGWRGKGADGARQAVVKIAKKVRDDRLHQEAADAVESYDRISASIANRKPAFAPAPPPPPGTGGGSGGGATGGYAETQGGGSANTIPAPDGP